MSISCNYYINIVYNNVRCLCDVYGLFIPQQYCLFTAALISISSSASPPSLHHLYFLFSTSVLLSLSRFPSSALTHIRSFTQHMAHTIPSYISRTPRWEKFQATWHWWYSHALGSTEYITFYLSPLFIALSRGGTCSAPARWSKCWCSQATFVFSRPLAFLEFIGTDTKLQKWTMNLLKFVISWWADDVMIWWSDELMSWWLVNDDLDTSLTTNI